MCSACAMRQGSHRRVVSCGQALGNGEAIHPAPPRALTRRQRRRRPHRSRQRRAARERWPGTRRGRQRSANPRPRDYRPTTQDRRHRGCPYAAARPASAAARAGRSNPNLRLGSVPLRRRRGRKPAPVSYSARRPGDARRLRTLMRSSRLTRRSLPLRPTNRSATQPNPSLALLSRKRRPISPRSFESVRAPQAHGVARRSCAMTAMISADVSRWRLAAGNARPVPHDCGRRSS